MSEEQDMINEVPGSSPEFRTELAEQLAELAPEAIADGKIDVEKLKELLECDASDTSERFGLFWPGKKRAMRAAQTPTTATLRPDKENSKDWDTTKNVFIEGDNLEVLKILQKHYHGKIKMIYIDPPYNTGKDFVYPDNYKEGLETYLEWSKQVNEDGKKLSSNSESEGRYHSNWLNMMYPRLKLARNLLASDGFIAVSIGDDEVGTLRLLMDTVFGEDNRIAQVSVNRTSEIATELTVQKIEYLLVYARHIIDTELGAADKIVESRGTVGNIDQTMPLIEFPSGLRCVNIPDGTYDSSRQIEGSNENIELIDQAVVSNGSLAKPVRLKARWRASNDMRKFFANDCQPTKAKINGIITEIYIDGDRFMPKIVKRSVEKLPTFFGSNHRGSKDLEALNLAGFDFPKSVDFIRWLLAFGLKDDDIVLDFFAGSGTTGQAAFEYAKAHQIRANFILVQLPEPFKNKSGETSIMTPTISSFARERLQRAGSKLIPEGPANSDSTSQDTDLGFRSYKLADTNFTKWRTDSDIDATVLEQHLLDLRESADDSATPDDLLTEILLKQGHSLVEQIRDRDIDGLSYKAVVRVDDEDGEEDTLVLAYLDEHTKPTLTQLREALNVKPAQFIMLEDGFQGDDELKTNLAQICKTNDIELWTA